jgi:hypothetical protein
MIKINAEWLLLPTKKLRFDCGANLNHGSQQRNKAVFSLHIMIFSPRFELTSDQVEDHVRVGHGLADGLLVAQVERGKEDLESNF